MKKQPRDEGNIKVRSTGRIDSEEFRRRHSHDGEGKVVNRYRLARRARRVAEPAACQSVAEHHHGRRTGPIIVTRNQSPRRRRHVQSLEIIAGNVFALKQLGLAPGEEIQF